MSNGKGSKPRPVKGDTYRANYEAIFGKRKPDVIADEAMFERCITRRRVNGRLYIRCKRGNFSVGGPDAAQVEAEARHYWRQYFNDGEYKAMEAV